MAMPPVDTIRAERTSTFKRSPFELLVEASLARASAYMFGHEVSS